jgi:hypothetical protein
MTTTKRQTVAKVSRDLRRNCKDRRDDDYLASEAADRGGMQAPSEDRLERSGMRGSLAATQALIQRRSTATPRVIC